jgi:type I restriction-modification system DNA methylase subunit
MIEPYKGKIYDPCCGSGGMFVQSVKFVENHEGNKKDISIYGQEQTATTYKLAKMNLAVRGLSANLGEVPADTFFKDQHPDLKADFIMANPPFNLKDWRGPNELTDGAAALEDDGIPFETKMQDLSRTLYGQMAESKELDAIICENLAKMGFSSGN